MNKKFSPSFHNRVLVLLKRCYEFNTELGKFVQIYCRIILVLVFRSLFYGIVSKFYSYGTNFEIMSA